MRRLGVLGAFMVAAATLTLSLPVSAGDNPMDPGLRKKAKRAVDAGLRYLRTQQADDGSWSGSVGVTALGLRAFLEAHRGYNEGDGPFITRPVQFIRYYVNTDGSISETNNNRNYNTAVAIAALQATGNTEYDEIIANGVSGHGFLGIRGDRVRR